jgi:hypothetical protein
VKHVFVKAAARLNNRARFSPTCSRRETALSASGPKGHRLQPREFSRDGLPFERKVADEKERASVRFKNWIRCRSARKRLRRIAIQSLKPLSEICSIL